VDALIVHITENKFFYSMLLVVLGAAALWSLSRYFATKKELIEHKELLEQHWEANNIKMENHRIEFTAHKQSHFALRDMVVDINSNLKHLPNATQTALMREEMALLRGRLEGMEPLFKNVLNNQNMLFENELRGAQSGDKK
tara:strand:- start:101339 stop:101761 length:423 start_codon:yes stop_codon:yes gene_type:complete